MSLGGRKGGRGVGGWSVECRGESVEEKREHRRVYTHSTLSSLCPAGKVSLASGRAGLSQVVHDDQEVDCRGEQLCWEIRYLHGVAVEGASRGFPDHQEPHRPQEHKSA